MSIPEIVDILFPVICVLVSGWSRDVSRRERSSSAVCFSGDSLHELSLTFQPYKQKTSLPCLRQGTSALKGIVQLKMQMYLPLGYPSCLLLHWNRFKEI